MNHTKKILRLVPFLKHLSNEEMDHFFKYGRLVTIRPGQLVDVKKTNSLNVVLEGIFEIESIGNRDVVYLSPGSFFGSIPFSEIRRKGNIKALVDSRLFIINEEELYRFFLIYSKALRGYIKILNRIGFDISDAGKQYFNSKFKVITVFSGNRGSGKSFLASSLGFSLSGFDEVVVLDLSYSGKSVFEFFGERLTAPLSEKPENESRALSLIQDRLIKSDDGPDLLNVSFSSRVKTDPEIIGHLIFILAKTYKYIIADLSNDDPDLRDQVFARSDFIFNIVDGKKDKGEVNTIFDRTLQDGQRIIAIRNSSVSGDGGAFYGGLILDICDEYINSGDREVLKKFAKSESVEKCSRLIEKNSKALVLQSHDKDSVFLAGFLSELNKNERQIDYLYSSSYSYFLTSLFLLLGKENLKDGFRRFFSSEQVNRNCDITFPERYVFKTGNLIKYCEELAGARRIEMFQSLPLCRLMDVSGSSRLFSSGEMSRLMAASFVSSPLFEPVKINGREYYSGFPGNQVSGVHLFRTEADDITFLSVRNKENLQPGSKIIELYASWLKSSLLTDTGFQGEDIFTGKNLILEVSSEEFRFDKIFEETQILAEPLVGKV